MKNHTLTLEPAIRRNSDATLTRLNAAHGQRILAAYNDARKAEADYATKAIICGQLMLEQRASMTPFCHDGKTGQFALKKDGEKFGDWLESVGISSRTAYRWMEAAERVARLQLHIPAADDFNPFMDIGGESVPLSTMLTGSGEDLSEEARAFRQGVFDFMADKTISEAINAAIDGDSPAHRITRAGNGKSKGGDGQQDRKEFEKFTATKLRHITTFLKQKLTQTQKGLILAAFSAALEAWPRWLVEAIADKCKSEIKLSDPERAARETN